MLKPYRIQVFSQSWRLISIGSLIIIVVILFLNAHSFVSLLDEGILDTLALWKGDSWGLAITDNEDVRKSGGELVSTDIFDVSDIERTWVLLDGLHGSNSTDVVSSDKHDS